MTKDENQNDDIDVRPVPDSLEYENLGAIPEGDYTCAKDQKPRWAKLLIILTAPTGAGVGFLMGADITPITIGITILATAWMTVIAYL